MSIGPLATAPAIQLNSASPLRAPGTTDTPGRPDVGNAGGRHFMEVLTEGKRPAPPAGPGTELAPAHGHGKKQIAAAVAPAVENGGLRIMAERALDAEHRVEALIAAAGRGQNFSAAELIALQATVFRYSQTVEVISRAADRLVGTIKQTLSTQV